VKETILRRFKSERALALSRAIAFNETDRRLGWHSTNTESCRPMKKNTSIGAQNAINLWNKRELRDVIFHITDHKPKHHISRIIGKPITKRLSRR